MLSQFKINSRLMVIVGMAMAGMLAVALVGLLDLRSSLFADRQEKLKNLVETALSAIADQHQRAAKGELPESEALQRALAITQSMHYGQGDYFFVFDPNGVLLAHPNPKIVGQNRIEDHDPYGVYQVREFLAQSRQGGGFVHYHYPRTGQDKPLPKLSYAAPFEPWKLTIVTGIYIDDINALFWKNAVAIGGIILLLLAGVGTIALWIANGIRKPLQRITERMGDLAAGNLAIDIPGTANADEVGAMARAVVIFKESMVEARRLAEEQHQDQEARHRRAEQIEGWIADFDRSVSMVIQRVSASAVQLRAGAQSLSATTGQTSQQAMAVAAAAEQASANVQAVATATEELSASVGEIGRQVEESSLIATTAVDAANRTNVTVAGLSEAAQKIGEVVQLINGIASQTNLLALNATIEAARAGEAGKGFAVVASEVKSLANQTAKATEDIQAQVGQMQAVTGIAVEAIRGITDTIQRMSAITTTIAGTVSQQDAAAREIASNVNQATVGTADVSTNITGVSKAVCETGNMATQTLSATEDMNQQAEHLRGVVDGFIRQVRAA